MLNKKHSSKKKTDKPAFFNYAKYSALAFQMIAIIFAGIFVGMQMDKWLNFQKPIFTALLAFLSVVLAIYYAIKDV